MLRAALTLAIVSGGAAPASAGAQVLKQIVTAARARVEATKQNAAARVTGSASAVVDSSLDRTDRAVAAAADAAQRTGDSTVVRAGRVVKTAALSATGSRSGADAAALRAALAAGHYVMRDTLFVTGSAQITPDGSARIAQLAVALASLQTTFMVEVHASDAADLASNETVSKARAAALKSALVAAGVSPAHVYVAGYGASRPPSDGGAPTRVEFTAAQ